MRYSTDYGLISRQDKITLDKLRDTHIPRKEVETQYVLQNDVNSYLKYPVDTAVGDKNGNDIVETYTTQETEHNMLVANIVNMDRTVDLTTDHGVIRGQLRKILTDLEQIHSSTSDGICIIQNDDDLEPEDQAFFAAAKTEADSGIKIGNQTFTVIGIPYYILNPGEQSATINMEMI